jgi:cell wall-associated NlpC family hydrolase
LRRVVAVLLALSVLLSAVPFGAFARPTTSTDTSGTATTQDTQDTKTETDTKKTTKKKKTTELEKANEKLATATPAQTAALQALNDQLDAIDKETEIAAEEYNAAKLHLASIESDIKVKKKDYELIKQAYELQAAELDARVRDYYREGGNPGLMMLFESKSFADFTARLRYAAELSTIDADLLQRIRDQRDQLADTLNKLANDEAQAESLEFELRARKIEVTARNEDRQAELRAQNKELLDFMNATTTRDRINENTLAVEIKTGKLKDVVITDGSPVQTALAYRGIPYKWGGASKSGFDCSGLVMYVFKQHGVSLPHHSASQALKGTKVTGLLQANDVVFFGSPIHHVGIYIGGGYYIHAPRTGDVVKISALSSRRDLTAARRYSWTTRTKAPL